MAVTGHGWTGRAKKVSRKYGSKLIWPGDTFGLSYRELDTDQGAFGVPTTTPSQFDPAQLVAANKANQAAEQQNRHHSKEKRRRELASAHCCTSLALGVRVRGRSALNDSLASSLTSHRPC